MTAYVRVATLLLMLFAASPIAWAEGLPTDIMLVFDNSGSMRNSDPHYLAKKAITHFVDGLPADTHFGVLIFDKAINLALPLTALSEDGKKAVANSLKAINYRGQLTNSPSAMERALYELRVNGRDNAQKLVVFMTDGIVDVGNPSESQDKATWLREELADEAAKNKIRIYAIAFTDKADYQLIQSLATKTNGEYYRALKAEDLHDAFERIGQSIAKLQPPKPPAPVTAEPKAAEVAPVATAPAPATPAVPATAAEAPAAPTAPEAAPAAPPQTAAPTPTPAAAPQSPTAVTPAPESGTTEFEKATGISKEELDKLPEGQAIIVRPEAENKGMGILIIGVGAALILLVIVALFIVVKKRGGKKAGATVARATMPEEEEYVPRAFLRDLQGNTDLSEHELGKKPAMMGRVPGSDAEHVHYIVVNQPTIGRSHALIEYRDFSFWIVDQASVNGTFVNGQKVTGEQRLKHGDKIRLHKYEFEFVMPEVADAGKTVFAGAADKTVMASEATVMQVEPVRPVAPASPIVHEEEEEDADEEDAFDVTGGFAVESLPSADAGLESVAAEMMEPEEEPAMPLEAESEAPIHEPAAPDLEPEESADLAAPAPEEAEVHDYQTVVLGPDSVPAAAQPAADLPPAEPEPVESGEAEDESLDSFISTTVLEASRLGAVPPKQDSEPAIAEKSTGGIGSEDPTVMPAGAGAPVEAPPPAAPSLSGAETAGGDDEMSLDDFLDDAALAASGIDSGSDKTVILTEDDESDKTLMPTQVESPGKPAAKKEKEETHMGDTTIFNAEDATLPPKRR